MGRLSLLLLVALVAGCAHARKLQQDPVSSADAVGSVLGFLRSPFQAFKGFQAGLVEREPP